MQRVGRRPVAWPLCQGYVLCNVQCHGFLCPCATADAIRTRIGRVGSAQGLEFTGLIILLLPSLSRRGPIPCYCLYRAVGCPHSTPDYSQTAKNIKGGEAFLWLVGQLPSAY